MCSDIEVPPLEIAIGPRVDRRVGEGLRRPWQDDFLSWSAFFWRDDIHSRDGTFLCCLPQSRFGGRARMNAQINREHKDGNDTEAHELSGPARSRPVRTAVVGFRCFRLNDLYSGSARHIRLAG